MNQKSLIACSIPLDRDGVHRGYLHIPHSVHRSAYGRIPVPIAAYIRGIGPTVLLTGGVHGDEYEDPVFLSDLARTLKMLDLSGRLITPPSLNHPAYLAGARTSPVDGVNLNRCFPGSRDGSVTEMIAHFVSTEDVRDRRSRGHRQQRHESSPGMRLDLSRAVSVVTAHRLSPSRKGTAAAAR